MVTVTGAISTNGQTAAQLETQERALRALEGTRGKLWRQWDSSGTWEWVWARCLPVNSNWGLENSNYIDLTFPFQAESAVWNGEKHGVDWYTDDGHFTDEGLYTDEGLGDSFTLTGSPQTCTVTNTGNAPVYNPIITITAGNANITALDLAVAGIWHVVYTGTIAATKSLVINCGAWSAVNDGTEDYAHFDISTSHTVEALARLAVGANAVVVTYTGGGVGSAIYFDFSDGWR
jgi:hypothetical protein